MTETALVNARVLLDGGFASDVAVVIAGERIRAVVPESALPAAIPCRDLSGALLLPGFIDTQVNGGAGVLFNDSPSVEGIEAIAAAHRRYGTTGFLPTLISDEPEVIAAGIAAVDEAIGRGIPGVLGIHIEGPFLNVGRKGIHDPERIRTIDRDSVALLTRPGRGVRMVTLAPEKVGPEVIAELSWAGARVSAGHTEATAAQIFEALDHGLKGFTHLFNAMSPLRARAPGTVGAALYDERGWCGIIVDGKHVDPVTLKLALRATDARRLMLVTDAMPTVGAANKRFELQGRAITVQDGVCVDANGTLAGSDLDMASAVRNCVSLAGTSLETAVAMASAHPAAFLGLERELGRIAPGYRADLVLATDRLEVLDTWIGGVSTTREGRRAVA